MKLQIFVVKIVVEVKVSGLSFSVYDSAMLRHFQLGVPRVPQEDADIGHQTSKLREFSFFCVYSCDFHCAQVQLSRSDQVQSEAEAEAPAELGFQNFCD